MPRFGCKLGVTPEQVIESMRRLPFGGALEFSEPGQIRALSLNIFDRSFAITYLLEAVAIIIGLLGVAASFSAQTLARTKEFGILRHIGVTRRQILGMLAAEGGLLTALGIALGFVARLVHQPDSCLHRKSTVLPLDHAVESAMERIADGCPGVAGVGRTDCAGVGASCGIGQCNTRGKGGLVMLFF